MDSDIALFFILGIPMTAPQTPEQRAEEWSDARWARVVAEPSRPHAQRLMREAYLAGFDSGIAAAAEVGSKAAWMHFHKGGPNDASKPPHQCNRTDWGYSDAVETAIRALRSGGSGG